MNASDHPRRPTSPAEAEAIEMAASEWLARREEGPLSPTETAAVLRSLREALAPLHDRSLVHGDLTPLHVLVDPRAPHELVVRGFGRGAILGDTRTRPTRQPEDHP